MGEAQRLAQESEAAGAESIWLADVRREPHLLSAAALSTTSPGRRRHQRRGRLLLGSHWGAQQAAESVAALSIDRGVRGDND